MWPVLPCLQHNTKNSKNISTAKWYLFVWRVTFVYALSFRQLLAWSSLENCPSSINYSRKTLLYTQVLVFSLLWQQCHMLESHFTLKKFLVDMFLNDPDFITKSLYTTVINQERDLLISKAIAHPSTSLIYFVSKQSSWLKIWSAALDHGSKGTGTIQRLIKILAQPSFEVSTVQSVINWSHHLYYFTISHVILSRLITLYLLMTYLTPSLTLIMIYFVKVYLTTV